MESTARTNLSTGALAMNNLLRQTIASTSVVVLLLSSSAYPLQQAPQQTSALPAPAVAASAPSGPVKYAADGRPVLEEGTPVRLRLTRTLSSADCKTGDQVDFEVLDPIKLGTTEVISQGALALATVTDAHSKKSMGRGGKLDVNIDSVKLTNGQKAALRAVKETKGGGHTGAMTGAMVATGIVFFPAAPLFLFIKGKDITIPKGTEITAYVNADTPFTPIAPAPASATSTAAASSAILDIVSTPDGADIEIDGAFSGDTPAKLTLAPGDHTITVKKSGYQPWERKMHVIPGTVSLKANLQSLVAN